MTAQISDHFIYNNESYALTGFTDDIAFHPSDYKITTKAASTACWRGFTRIFSVENNELVIKNFNVNDANISQKPFAPEINGIKPKHNKAKLTFFNKIYENINLKIDFTGSILIGKDFIRELYRHMGFHPAWKYTTVFELTFEDGNLINFIDLPKKTKEFREELKQKRKTTSNKNEIAKWIEESFNQKYVKK